MPCLIGTIRKPVPKSILVEEQKKEVGKSKVLQLPVPTRWGTYAALVNSIHNNRGALESAIWDRRIKGDAAFNQTRDELRELICNNADFWNVMIAVKEMLDPLAEAITMIEGNVADPARAYKTIEAAFSKTITAVRETEHIDEEAKDEFIEVRSINWTVKRFLSSFSSRDGNSAKQTSHIS